MSEPTPKPNNRIDGGIHHTPDELKQNPQELWEAAREAIDLAKIDLAKAEKQGGETFDKDSKALFIERAVEARLGFNPFDPRDERARYRGKLLVKKGEKWVDYETGKPKVAPLEELTRMAFEDTAPRERAAFESLEHQSLKRDIFGENWTGLPDRWFKERWWQYFACGESGGGATEFLLTLFWHARGKSYKYCYPGIRTLAREVKVSPGTIEKLTWQFVWCGIIRRVDPPGRKKKKGSNGYHLEPRSRCWNLEAAKVAEDEWKAHEARKKIVKAAEKAARGNCG